MSITHINRNRSKRQSADQKLIEGLIKHSQTVSSVLIRGRHFKTDDLIALLQDRLVAANTANSTRATWLTAVQADHDEYERTKATISGLRQALAVAFAGEIDGLADFGLTPRKVRVMSPEQMSVATAKAKATRAARHTMGKRQKQLIKGTVPATATATATAIATATATPTATPTATATPTTTPTATPTTTPTAIEDRNVVVAHVDDSFGVVKR
jgi:hypothetical protein